TALNLGVAQSRNELRALTTQESHGFSRVESQDSSLCFLDSHWWIPTFYQRNPKLIPSPV
ncbi:hypothetical protein, partial [Thermoactinomyces intermedius]|uniref:hypothetical protein n=1 Tax=Thermoactinomyces intermedius TaxID=2024 RepID=UPI001C688AF5